MSNATLASLVNSNATLGSLVNSSTVGNLTLGTILNSYAQLTQTTTLTANPNISWNLTAKANNIIDGIAGNTIGTALTFPTVGTYIIIGQGYLKRSDAADSSQLLATLSSSGGTFTLLSMPDAPANVTLEYSFVQIFTTTTTNQTLTFGFSFGGSGSISASGAKLSILRIA